MLPKFVRLGLLVALAGVGAVRIAATNWHVLISQDGRIAIDPWFAISLSLAAIIFFFGESGSSPSASDAENAPAETASSAS